MDDAAFNAHYARVPEAQRNLLRGFRATHPRRRVEQAGRGWEYMVCGQGSDALVILPGAMGRYEIAYRHILALETSFRVLGVDYPDVPTMTALVDGIAGVLDAEGIKDAHVLGGSYGGLVAQCLIRRHGQRVKKLILSHTAAANPGRIRWVRLACGVLRIIPMGVVRGALKLGVRKLLSALGDEREFWRAYLEESLPAVRKGELLAGYQRVLDFEMNYGGPLAREGEWTGRILILESDNDPMAPAAERARLRNAYLQARVHTFLGSGHIAAFLHSEEYLRVVQEFLLESAGARPGL